MNIEVTGKHGTLKIIGPYGPSDAEIVALCQALYEEQQQMIKAMRKLLYSDSSRTSHGS